MSEKSICDLGGSVHAPATARSLVDRHSLAGVLENWSLPDLQRVLDVVDRRLATAELLDRLSRNPRAHESALHEVMMRSLWLFGVEDEDNDVCSNVTLKTVLKRLFGRTHASLANARQRPDLVIGPGGSIYGVASVRRPRTWASALGTHPALVVVELKRGGSRLTQVAMNQIEGYAHALANAGVLSTGELVHAWVVGDDIAPTVPTDRLLCNADRCYARIRATTYSALSDAARRQWPNALTAIQSRYRAMSLDSLIARASA